MENHVLSSPVETGGDPVTHHLEKLDDDGVSCSSTAIRPSFHCTRTVSVFGESTFSHTVICLRRQSWLLMPLVSIGLGKTVWSSFDMCRNVFCGMRFSGRFIVFSYVWGVCICVAYVHMTVWVCAVVTRGRC